MEEDFKQFLRFLKLATADITCQYFKISVAESNKLFMRERVYCYELYHQLRSEIEKECPSFPYKLDGEVDKAGHPHLKGVLKARKPDFIWHEPGTMGRNLVVIEVKSSITASKNMRGIKKDIKTLCVFTKEAGYYRGIQLIYGGNKKQIQRIKSVIDSCLGQGDKGVFLLWHEKPSKPFTEVKYW